MSYAMGNLSLNAIEKRLEITFTEDEREKLENMRQDIAALIEPGKWHCFDTPFLLVCGDIETAQEIAKILHPYESQMKGNIQIGIDRYYFC